MSTLVELGEGNYYQFTKQVVDMDDGQPIMFKARFIDIIKDTLRVTDYSDKDGVCKSNLRTMPLKWIIHAELLDEKMNQTPFGLSE